MDKHHQGRPADSPSHEIDQSEGHLDALLDELVCGVDQRAEASVQEIAAIGPQALLKLERLLQSTNPDHRWWALRVLAEIPGKRSVELSIAALQDPDPAVRHCAALCLGSNPDPVSIPHLVPILSHPDSLFASLATDALVSIGSEAVLPLSAYIDQSPGQAAIGAARALAQIGDPRAIPTLFQLLEADSALKVYWAEEGLDRMGVGMTFFQP